MKEKRKLSEKEKKELKDQIKKVSFTILHVISYILSIIFVISVAIGCSKNSQKADAVNYQGVVTTPIVQTYNAPNGYRVNATSLNNSLPSNYEIYLDYPYYNTGDNYLPYTFQFSYASVPLPSFNDNTYLIEEFYYPLQSFRQGSYFIRVYAYYDSSKSYCSQVRFTIHNSSVENIGQIVTSSSNNPSSPLVLDNSSLFDEIKYYNSYVSYSLSGVYYSGYTSNGGLIAYQPLPSSLNDRALGYLKSLWYYFSTDTWKGNIHLDSKSILNANNYILKNLTYEGLVGEEKSLSMISIIDQGVTTQRYFYDVQGSYYYKGQLYNSLVFYYEKVYKGDSSPFELYTGDINGSNIEHQKLLYKCNDSSYSNLFYLSGVALCNSPNLLDSSYYLNDNYQLYLYHVYSSEFTWSVFDSHQIFLNVFSSNQFNDKWTFDQGQFEFDIVFGYIYDDGYHNQYSFYQYITNSYVIPVIVDDISSVEDMFAQTYSWMIFAINSFAAILSFTILPGITLGAILLTPLVVTLIIFVAKLFKR